MVLYGGNEFERGGGFLGSCSSCSLNSKEGFQVGLCKCGFFFEVGSFVVGVCLGGKWRFYIVVCDLCGV